MASERDGKVYAMDDRYCVDNGAMIAWTGCLALKSGIETEINQSNVTQRFRTDDVDAVWRHPEQKARDSKA